MKHIILAVAMIAAPIASAGTPPWTDGVVYTYDAAGNVIGIGADTHAYDSVDRLARGSINGQERRYAYDAFGNRVSCAPAVGGDCQMGARINSELNRLQASEYDEAGNLTKDLDGKRYAYDAVNMLTGSSAGEYIYTADDERIAVLGTSGTWSWTLRDLSGKVLRELTSTVATDGTHENWRWTRDNIFRNGVLLSSRQPSGTSTSTLHYHLDHLGTPRVVSTDTGTIAGRHDYYPFGLEVFGNVSEETPSRLRFTGHERDFVAGELAPLDYMHARYYNAGWGRFLSVDPGKDWDPRKPQSWNMYAYTRSNPVNFTDPDGRRSDSPRNHCRGVTTGACGRANQNWATQSDGKFGAMMLQWSLFAVAAAKDSPTALRQFGMGLAAGFTKESSEKTATPKSMTLKGVDAGLNTAIGGMASGDVAILAVTVSTTLLPNPTSDFFLQGGPPQSTVQPKQVPAPVVEPEQAKPEEEDPKNPQDPDNTQKSNRMQ